MVQEGEKFSKWRQIFWPIHGYELKKLLPMLAMFFLISLVYSMLRNTKDTLIVTTSSHGANLIPFLKVYGVIPASVIYVACFAKLSQILSKKTLFVVALGPFLVYFTVFAWIYPIRDSLEPALWVQRFESILPNGLVNMAGLLRNWVLCSFYVMSELWGSAALSLLFWGFANDITQVSEAKRFYALFGVGANLALVAVKGMNAAIHLGEGHLMALLGCGEWMAYLTLLMVVVVCCILMIYGLYLYMHKVVLADPRLYQGQSMKVKPKASSNASFIENIRILVKSPVLKYIAIIVVAYGISINLLEVTWKSYLGQQYPNPSDYQDYMSNFSLATGITTLFLMLFVAGNVMRKFSWTTAALVTPVVLMLTGAGFFGFIIFKAAFAPWLLHYATTPVAVGVLFGTIQNVMSKASKYSLFDPTKEMAYIPLDSETRLKGKAAIDVVGARLGKAGGSLLQQGLIGIYGSLMAVTGQIALLLLGILGLWIWADVKLGREFGKVKS